ncbi:glycoside hydrolase family 88 protein [Ceratobasidium sp. AG-Ba]|nr:glycoside hydrolase family 88 protein [Ceratobasidium sp. AG-Ba]QRW05343.1 glycoside hydrolase family 88 protein [Ceratobasidium sp. AG-Ba]
MLSLFLAPLAIAVAETAWAAPISDIPSSVLTPDQINLVRSRLIEGAQASWELGTSTQALLEYDYPALSVYGPLMKHIRCYRQTRAEAFVYDTSVGDPASLGVAMLVANFTGATGGDYNTAIEQQLDYLLNKAPRNTNGAISHRSEQIQLWSDNLSMVPPFLAYYGALHNNPTVIAEGFNQTIVLTRPQISTYRDILKADSQTGLWRHIQLGANTDMGHWSSGNGWAASGMTRVLATVAGSSLSSSFSNEQANLALWTAEILTSAWAYQLPNGTLYNYPDLSSPSSATPNFAVSPSSAFSDASGTALLAATTYRLASHLVRYPNVTSTDATGVSTTQSLSDILARAGYSVRSLLTPASNARKAVAASIDPVTGWLQNVVNPWSYSQRGVNSPEGQAFVLMLEAAARDWEALIKSSDHDTLERNLGA